MAYDSRASFTDSYQVQALAFYRRIIHAQIILLVHSCGYLFIAINAFMLSVWR